MYQIKIDWDKLRKGEKVQCPECRKGYLFTKDNPAISHHFRCDKCGMQINID